MFRFTFFVMVAVSFAVATSCSRAETTPAASPTKQTSAEAEHTTVSDTDSSAPADSASPAKATATELASAAAAEPKPAEPTPPEQPTERTAQKSSSEAPQQEPAKSSGETADTKQPTKQEILNSLQWRRAMFEFSEWLSAQQIYTPQQVAQIKDQFNHRVAAMDAKELAYMLADMEAKFQVMNTPQAKEARAWMGQYLSVMSDRKRAEVLKDVPNIATMTAAQLNAEIQKIVEKRKDLNAEQEAFQLGQAQQVANQIQTDRTNQQNYVRDWNTGPVAYSPYRSQSNVNQRLNQTPTGSGMGFYVGPLGGVGMTFSPSSW